MRRAPSLLRGETRPQKCICPPQTSSPHSDLSHPPLEIWCAEGVQYHFSSVWQLGDALRLPPLPSVFLLSADHVLGDTIGSLLQCTDPAPAIFQPSASLSNIPNKDARGFPSWLRASPLPGFLDNPKSGMSSSIRHSASSIAFHSRMGASTRGLALGSPHSSVRLHTSVWEESPPLRWSSSDRSKQRLKGFCATTRTFLPPTERSDRGGTSDGHRTRAFQPILPCTKKGRRPETHSGSASPEPFPLQREVQDADDEVNHVSDSRRGLVCHYRPKGCFFSHAGRSATQEVPLVCLWREGLPIQGPSLRSGLGTENVHEVHGCCTGPFEVPGHSCAELFGRLAHSGSLQGAGESSQGYRSPPHSFSWPQNERQEECSFPLSANCVLGGSFGFRSDADPFGSCPGFQFHSMSSPLQARPSCLSEYLPQVARLHSSGLPCVAPRVAPHEAVPLVDERPETTPLITSHSPNQRVAQLISAPCTMRDPAFLQSGVSMGAIHRRHMITTDASMTGWGTVFEGRPAHGEWTGEFLSWHINCLELRAVFLALKHFLPVLGKHHIIFRTDNMAVVSHINHQGGSRSRNLDRLARRLLLWSQGKFLSLRAVHVPGILNSSFAGTYVVKESWRLAGPLCQ